MATVNMSKGTISAVRNVMNQTDITRKGMYSGRFLAAN
jgi:hypothetical protein